MWRRERDADALTEYQAKAAAAVPRVPEDDLGTRYVSGLPSAPPTTAGERHGSELAEKADPSSHRRIIKRILIHGTWIAAGIASAVAVGNRASDEAPKVGECAKLVEVHELVRVACDDASAKFRVTSRVDDATDGEAACATDPVATSFYSYRSGHDAVTFILCLTLN